MRKYKITYSRKVGETTKFKSVMIAAENLTAVVHEAERSNWVVDGWEWVGVEQC